MAESLEVRVSRFETWREEVVDPRHVRIESRLDAVEASVREGEARNWRYLGVLGGATFVANALALVASLLWMLFGDAVRAAIF